MGQPGVPVGLIRGKNMSNVQNLKNSDSATQRARRYKQMEMEENSANRLKAEGWQIFSPTVVCDRIGIKDNEVWFIEFKKPGQKLTENQQKIQDKIKNYLIENY